MSAIPFFLLRGFGAGGSTATPTLAVADNADGTGGVATITNADSDATVTVSSLTPGGSSWTNRGSRTGNGTVALSMTPGYCWFRAVASFNGAEATSNLVYAALTDDSESVLYRILTAVQARVQGLALTGVTSSNIVVRKVPTDRGVTLPGIIICPIKESTPANEGVQALDDVLYPVLIVCSESDNQESTLAANMNRHTLWRQTIRRAFSSNPRLTGVSEVINASVEPSDLCSFEAWNKNKWASGLIVRFRARETRIN